MPAPLLSFAFGRYPCPSDRLARPQPRPARNAAGGDRQPDEQEAAQSRRGTWENGDASFARRLVADAVITIVAGARRRPVGCVTGCVQAPNTVRPVTIVKFENVVIEPAFRGRHVGVLLAGEFLE